MEFYRSDEIVIRHAMPNEMHFVASMMHALWKDEGASPNDPAADPQRLEETLIKYACEGGMTLIPIIALPTPSPQPKLPAYGCIVCHTFQGVGSTGGLKVLPGAPKDVALRLIHAAALHYKLLSVDLVQITTSMRSPRGERVHKLYENCGFTPDFITHSGHTMEVLSNLEKRLSNGRSSTNT